jgi:tetratricopeptide (TPR) repeat protein
MKGRQSDAVALLSRALAIADAKGPLEPDVMSDLLNTLAVALSMGGRFLESLPAMRRSLELTESELGPRHASLAGRWNNIATVYMNINDLDQAAAAMDRALAIAREAVPEGDPFWHKLWINMAGLCQYRKQPDAATDCLRKVVGDRQLKPDSPMRAIALNNLGEIAVGQGRFDEARELLQQAIDIKQRLLGYDHPDLIVNLLNLGELHARTGDAVKAESLFLEAIRIGEARLGPGHHMVGVACYRYGGSLFERGYVSSARENLCRALGIVEAALGPGHPQTAEVRAKLGELCQGEGELAEARGHYTAALEALLACCGSERPEVGQLRERLAQLDAAERPGRRRAGPA